MEEQTICHLLSRPFFSGDLTCQGLIRAGQKEGRCPGGLGSAQQRDSRLGLFVEHTGDRDPVEALHLRQGRGQDLGGAHGGHVTTGLGQVAIEPQPVLQTRGRVPVSGSWRGWLPTCTACIRPRPTTSAIVTTTSLLPPPVVCSHTSARAKGLHKSGLVSKDFSSQRKSQFFKSYQAPPEL